MRGGYVIAVLLGLMLSGCAGSAPTMKQVAQSPISTAAPTAGPLSGRVTDDELRPLANVTVALDGTGIVQATVGDGSFRFQGLDVGTYTVVAEIPEYQPARQTVSLLANKASDVTLTLTKLPEFRPYSLLLSFKGHYDCAAEYLIVTGDCGIAYETVTCATGYCESDPVFKEKYEFPFEVEPRWQSLVAELTWEPAATNGLDGMRLYVEERNLTAGGGHSVKLGRADGSASPLSVRLDRGVAGPGADKLANSNETAMIPDLGGLEQVRVFPRGNLYDTTSMVCEPSHGCLLGVGAGLSVDFQVYVTLFYNQAAPEGFSAVAKA